MAQARAVTGPREVDAQTLRRWLEAGEAVLLDVREPAEHAAERIPAAKLMPSSRFQAHEVAAAHEGKVVVHCASGMRAGSVYEQLQQCGCDHVFLFREGVKGWREAGFEVVGTGKPPLPLMRQVQLVVGAMILAGTLAAMASPWFLLVPGFCGCGMLMAGATGNCALANVLARLPYNQRAGVGNPGSCSL
ncbi:MAG: rhodanese-like domain-containing protein [Armatimonadetes bacterium]|nr:rhodanese-like domain-containing protein [Armatimonadota bacterium]